MAERPQNPDLVAMNKLHKEVWAERSAKIEHQIRKTRGADVKGALENYRKDRIEALANGADPTRTVGIHKYILEQYERDKQAQTRRGNAPKRPRETPLDALMRDCLAANKSAKEGWLYIVRKADGHNEMGVEGAGENQVVSVFDDNGKIIRKIKRGSFDAVYSKFRREI